MLPVLIKHARIVNENKQFQASLYLNNGLIEDIFTGNIPENLEQKCKVINADGKLLVPGVIDDQVHFREPGLTHSGDLYTESRAAVAGGVTSFMDMPNVIPQTVTQELLEDRYMLAAKKSLANYSFYMGATNSNLDELLKCDPRKICGIKIFMGASTGNMLVDDESILSQIFEKSPLLIATHCEDTPTIQHNLKKYQKQYGDDIPITFHPKIRSAKACYKSSAIAVKLAKKHNTRLHLLHLSTAKEMELLDNSVPAEKKRITGEVCVHHLWFDERDYSTKQARIRWNPAIKSKADRNGLWEALLNDKLDVIATDHAPHAMEKKNGNYMQSASGGPMVQHSLIAMLEFVHQGKISVEKVVEKMCHTPAEIFKVKKRGFIRKGYHADLVLLSREEWTVKKNNILYKCGWSPFEGETFHYSVSQTFVNGNLVFDRGCFNEDTKGQRLLFNC